MASILNTQEIEPTFPVNETCPNCSFEYKTSKVRSSRIKTVKTDSDFCIHYQGVNPDFYLVKVCSACGYAYTDSFNHNLSNKGREQIYASITQKWRHHDYGGSRTINDAVTVYKLALLCAQITVQSAVVVGGICFKIACFNRIRNNSNEEKRFLKFSFDAYLEFFENERTSTMQINEARMIYLMAEIQRRLGEYRGAVKWFDRLVKDKTFNDPAISKKAREQWQVAREQLKQAQLKDETSTTDNMDE